MNRYRTIPGLAPSGSKATTTTTCQKCLKKGHYSYECKASVQNRPYTSRPSRSQQLQNPRLKPSLREQKMEEPKALLPEKADASPEPRGENSDKKPDALEALEEASQHFTSRKRQRSASSASSSSVATISTEGADSDLKITRTEHSETAGHESGLRSLSPSQSRSPPRAVDKHDRKHRDSHSDKDRSRPHVRDHSKRDDSGSDSEGVWRSPAARNAGRSSRGSKVRIQVQESSRGRERPDKRRRSRSADVLPNVYRQEGDPRRARQRSLSPYSRRLALTQAMNSGG